VRILPPSNPAHQAVLDSMHLLALASTNDGVCDEYYKLAYAHDVLSDSMEDIRCGRIQLEEFLKSMDQVNQELKSIKRTLRESQRGQGQTSSTAKKRALEGGSMDESAAKKSRIAQ